MTRAAKQAAPHPLRYLKPLLCAMIALATALTHLHAATPQALQNILQNGDLIFVKSSESAFDKAISQATQKTQTSYTHVGIYEHGFVLEAEPTNGVVRTPLAAFLKANPHFDIKRLNAKKRASIDLDSVLLRAKAHLGEPYDFTYIANNGAMYCSELVYEAFVDKSGAPIFHAKPMNFYAPDGSLPAYWQQLFSKLGVDVPQGELGTNPNALSREDFLESIPLP